MALKNMLTREIKYAQKNEKSAFREFFVARYIPILQYQAFANLKSPYRNMINTEILA